MLRWRERFGLDIVDGIGSTEMLHIYCSNRPGELEPGTSGRPVPGYELRLVGEDGAVLERAGGRRPGGPRRFLCRLLLASARKEQAVDARRVVCHR